MRQDQEGFAPPVVGLMAPTDVDWDLLERDLVAGYDPGDPPPDPHAWDGADAIDRAVADLRAADRAMARVLRQVAAASGRDGLSVRRQVALLAGATGSDVAFLERAVQVLAAMPRTQQAFDEEALSWSQIRGIVLEARRLSVAQRAVLDDALAGTVIQGRDRGEPDQVVEICGDIAARLDVEGQERLEQAQQRTQRFGLQLDFEGWGIPFGQLTPEVTATLSGALDLLADAPIPPGAPPASDDEGTPLPAVAQPPRTRGAQWAEALERMAAMALGGTSSEGLPRRARPRVSIIAPLADLLDSDGGGVGSVTSRLCCVAATAAVGSVGR